ncbi:GNAT family N-acetyltransferase [Amphritea sp. 2_MG-2023]|uniref:GNAT family N-acetyltransferase n=1 Tax=Amphritea TaxID=515417 RepID=UPI001C0797A0|nr:MULTISPECIES: GNAT family N-acetyltransferase [Amphritea]MBU2966625.1 GNAT family N-acetyltransferase [Amphritea atlantica]MDO6417516.1 GNAT family N-acetyltransferase [Amphritea sp. 2_MG-2023]
MPYKIPTSLTSERLTLTKTTIEDWPALHHFYKDEESTRYTTGRPLSEGESWRIVAALIGHWEIHGYGPYTVKLKDNETVIGLVGLWYPGDWPEPEIMWSLIPGFSGQGYAAEAALAVRALAATYLPELHLISLIYEQNFASRKLALAVGATLERKFIFRDKEALIYRHPLPLNAGQYDTGQNAD